MILNLLYLLCEWYGADETIVFRRGFSMFCREMDRNSTVDLPCLSLAGFVLLSASQLPIGGIRLPDDALLIEDIS